MTGCGRADGRCHRVSGPTIRRGGVGSTSPGAFVLDAEFVRRWVVEAAARIDEQRDFLTQLDAAIGDADHGVNMQRGFAAAVATLQSSPDRSPGSLLEEVGKTLVYRVGGAAGPLYGTGFRQIGATVSEAVTPDGEVLLSALRAGLEGIQALGAAAAGDKTMVDAWEPAVAAFERTLRVRRGHARRRRATPRRRRTPGSRRRCRCRRGRGGRPTSGRGASAIRTPARPRPRSSSGRSSEPSVARRDRALLGGRSPRHDPVRRPSGADPQGAGQLAATRRHGDLGATGHREGHRPRAAPHARSSRSSSSRTPDSGKYRLGAGHAPARATRSWTTTSCALVR